MGKPENLTAIIVSLILFFSFLFAVTRLQITVETRNVHIFALLFVILTNRSRSSWWSCVNNGDRFFNGTRGIRRIVSFTTWGAPGRRRNAFLVAPAGYFTHTEMHRDPYTINFGIFLYKRYVIRAKQTIRIIIYSIRYQYRIRV